MKLNSNASALSLIILSIFGTASILLSVFISNVLNQELESTNFKLNPIIISNFDNSKELFEITPLKSKAFSKLQIEDFTKKLIMEYITVRYTVNGSKYMMLRDLGINDKNENSIYASILKLPSYNLLTGEYNNQAYQSFKNAKNNEYNEIIKLLNENTTRSVKITKEPYRYKDKWKTEVEFIYKTPSTNSLSEALKEHWEINMEIEPLQRFRNIPSVKNIVNINPSSLFEFKINTFEKIRK